MPRNGSGVYSLPAGTLASTHTTISTASFNAFANDVATELTNSMAVSGSSPLTGPLNMGSNAITSVADPVNLQDASTKNYVDGTAATEVTIALTGTSITLTEQQAAARHLILTGTLTAGVTITFPASPINQTWIDNQCVMGAFAITIASIGGGSNATLTNTGITPVFHGSMNITTLISSSGLYAPTASPSFTGTPTAPTASTATNTTQLATTAFVQANLSSYWTASTTSSQISSALSGYATTGSLASASVNYANSAGSAGSVSSFVPSYGGVGSYVIYYGSQLTANTTYSASTIGQSSGTWRCQSVFQNGSYVNLVLRIS